MEQPKGIEVVKEGIRKLKFNQQLRKSEGSKIPKVELTISIDGVAIQEPKTKRIMHQYPLHRISYCADDKGEKRFFSFIAKESGDNEQNSCLQVFLGDLWTGPGSSKEDLYIVFSDTVLRLCETLDAENTVLRQRLRIRKWKKYKM